jgi:hypothetical protein
MAVRRESHVALVRMPPRRALFPIALAMLGLGLAGMAAAQQSSYLITTIAGGAFPPTG